MIGVVFRRTYLFISLILFVSSLITVYAYYSLGYDFLSFSSVSRVMSSSYDVYLQFFNNGVLPGMVYVDMVRGIFKNYNVLSMIYESFYVSKVYHKIIEVIIPIILILQAIASSIILAYFNPEETLQIITLIGRRKFFQYILYMVIIVDMLLAVAVGIPYTFFTKGFSVVELVVSVLSIFSLLFLVSLIILVFFILSSNPFSSLVVGLSVFILFITRPDTVFYISPFIHGLEYAGVDIVSKYTYYVIIYCLWVSALLVVSYSEFMRRELY